MQQHERERPVVCGSPVFFFNDTATTEIYTLSLHDALPIWPLIQARHRWHFPLKPTSSPRDRKSTRLNSSHANISYAVFCLKKKNTNINSHYLHITPGIIFTVRSTTSVR